MRREAAILGDVARTPAQLAQTDQGNKRDGAGELLRSYFRDVGKVDVLILQRIHALPVSLGERSTAGLGS